MSASSEGPLRGLWSFPLLEALFGRRARRFGLGMELPPGPLQFKSRHGPAPLTKEEQAVLVAAGAGVSGWNFGIPYSPATEGRISTYTLRYTGRTFPTGAGIGTPELIYTDDDGVYMTRLRDTEPEEIRPVTDAGGLDGAVTSVQRGVVKIKDGRLTVPREPPHTSEHNIWNANVPGSTLFMPVVDLGEYFLALLSTRIQNRVVVYDDRAGRLAGDLEPFVRSGLLDGDKRVSLSQVEQSALAGNAASLGIMGHNLVLTMQAMGLGGWMYSGISSLSLMGAFQERGIPGLGFRFQRDARWPVPNPIGLDGVYESVCPPYQPDLRTAARLLAERKFGSGGAYDPGSEGPFLRTDDVMSSAEPYSDEMVECSGEVAQYIYDTYGKFPGSIPTMFMQIIVQAQHIDTEFYDKYFKAGAYLETHADHMRLWHDVP